MLLQLLTTKNCRGLDLGAMEQIIEVTYLCQ